jgi:hypothetical protein
MDKFVAHFRGVRGGRVCPCCADVGVNTGAKKRANTRIAKARFKAATRSEISFALAD